MREARTLGSWVLGLFLAVMLLWVAADTLAPQPPAQNHLFAVFRETSGVAYFEPLGRFGVGVLEVIAALLILVPFTRRIGAILGFLVMLFLAALVVQLVMQGITYPVDMVGEGGVISTVNTDPSGLFYLILGLLVAAIAVIVIHPGRSDAKGDYYKA
jgi:hypothetical protein